MRRRLNEAVPRFTTTLLRHLPTSRSALNPHRSRPTHPLITPLCGLDRRTVHAATATVNSPPTLSVPLRRSASPANSGPLPLSLAPAACVPASIDDGGPHIPLFPHFLIHACPLLAPLLATLQASRSPALPPSRPRARDDQATLLPGSSRHRDCEHERALAVECVVAHLARATVDVACRPLAIFANLGAACTQAQRHVRTPVIGSGDGGARADRRGNRWWGCCQW